MNPKSLINHCKKKDPLPNRVGDILKKFDVDIEKIKAEVNFIICEMTSFEKKGDVSIFGEKESASYIVSFSIYNVEFQTKLLTFEYQSRTELLKLDLHCKTSSFQKEMQYCCNFLQRKRNLNLMFTTLISMARRFEARRLICELLLQKDKHFTLEDMEEGGKVIIYSSRLKTVKIIICWIVDCNADYLISDKVEVFHKISNGLPNKADIVNCLIYLTKPTWDFNDKYHLWKNLLSLLNAIPNDLPSICQSCSYCMKHILSNQEKIEPDVISVIRHRRLNDRMDIKIEKTEPEKVDEDVEVDVASVSSTVEHLSNQSKSLCAKHCGQSIESDCIPILDNDDKLDSHKKNVKFSRKNMHLLGFENIEGLLQDNKSAENKTRTMSKEMSPSKIDMSCDNTNNLSSLDQEMITIIEINDGDSECVTSVPSTKSTKSQSPKPSTSTSLRHQDFRITPKNNIPVGKTLKHVIELDDELSSKRQKTIDQDLEITGVTYLVPD